MAREHQPAEGFEAAAGSDGSHQPGGEGDPGAVAFRYTILAFVIVAIIVIITIVIIYIYMYPCELCMPERDGADHDGLEVGGHQGRQASFIGRGGRRLPLPERHASVPQEVPLKQMFI